MSKSKRVLVLVNTLTSIHQFIYSNHIGFFTRCIRDYPKDQFIFFTPPRMSIDGARNEAARIALQAECDYLLFLDDDVIVPANAYKMLRDANKDMIAGLVIIRGEPFNVMAFVEKELSKSKAPKGLDGPESNPVGLTYFNDLPKDKKGKLIEEPAKCDAVGFSLCLLKVDMLQAMTPPYFITGPNNTEDVYFCMKARKELDPEPTVYIHPGIKCTHMLHPEGVNWDNREALKHYYSELRNIIANQTPSQDVRPERSLNTYHEYLKQNTTNTRKSKNAKANKA